MRFGIPAVKITDDTDGFGVGCHDGKEGTLDPLDFHSMGAEFVIQVKMIPLFIEVDVIIGKPADAVDDIVAGSFGCFNFSAH